MTSDDERKVGACANVLLDAVSIGDPDANADLSPLERDAAIKLALQRLAEIRAIDVWDEPDGTVQLDPSPLVRAAIELVLLLLKSISEHRNADFDTVLATTREHLLSLYPD